MSSGLELLGGHALVRLPRGRIMDLTRVRIMGILNVTPDSFSDAGRFMDSDRAVARAEEMIAEGADIIDIGGESTRPGATPLSAEEEINRVLPVLRMLRTSTEVPISVDTYHGKTARVALEAGADIINDITAGRTDVELVKAVSEHEACVVLMHMLGTPVTMQIAPEYSNVTTEIQDFFTARIQYCEERGVSQEQLILDPGIGFGKTVEDNLTVLRHLRDFASQGLPILVGVSRKSFIPKVSGVAQPPNKRIGGSIAAATMAILSGASIIRAHDVRETVEAVRVIEAIRTSS